MSDAPLRAQVEALARTLVAGATQPSLDQSLMQSLGPVVEPDTLDAPSAEEVLRRRFDPDRRRMLDFGCGGSHHRPFIEGLGYHWTGIDYLAGVAPGVAAAVATQPDVVFYDGLVMPFPDASFDVVYAMLSLQCVQDIRVSFAEIARVLRPGGHFIGQSASLEVMQDFTTYNFTPHGFRLAVEAGGMRLNRMWPKHDALSFLLRRVLIELNSTARGEVDGLLNPDGLVYRLFAEKGAETGMSARDINLMRLLFSAHFVFEAEKPADAPMPPQAPPGSVSGVRRVLRRLGLGGGSARPA